MMDTIQIPLLVLFLLVAFAAVLGLLLQRNRDPGRVPALVAVTAFLFLCIGAVLLVLVIVMQDSSMLLLSMLLLEAAAVCCWLVWFLLHNLRQLNKGAAALFATYFLAVLFITLLSRQGVHNTSVITEFVLPGALHDPDEMRHLLQNVVLFLPLGVLLPAMHRDLRGWYWVLLCGTALSTMIETAQLLAAAGQCDVNDIAANALGALLGYSVFCLLNIRRRSE